MAEGTTEFFLRPQDGWTAVVTGGANHVLIRAPRAHIGLAVGANAPSLDDVPASAILSYTGRPTAGTHATAVLTFEDDADTGDAVVAGDTVEIGDITYTFRATVDAENEVLLGADNLESAANLVDLVNNGDDFTDPNPDWRAEASSLVVTFTALIHGNTLNTAATVATSDGMAFGAADAVNGVNGSNITLAGVTYHFVDELSQPDHVPGGWDNEVLIGADAAGDYDNLVAAINGTGTPGTTYSTSLVSRPGNISASNDGVDDVTFTAGPNDNGTAISENLANATFDDSATELSGGSLAVRGFQFGGLTSDFDATIRLDDVQGNVYVRALNVGARNLEIEPVRVAVIVTGTTS